MRSALGRLAVAVMLAVAIGPTGASAAPPDVFQQAVDYLFTGELEPAQPVEIVDRRACIVVVPDPAFNRRIRYYLGRFDMEHARITTRYSGSRAMYDLDVRGDDVVLEYLDPNTGKVLQAYRSAQVRLPGNIEQSRRALQFVFADGRCRARTTTVPF